MSRHQRAVAAVVLGVLTALPISGTVCAELCDSAAGGHAAAHHGSGMNCAEAPPSTGVQISGVSTHDCSTHDPSLRQVSFAAADRADCVFAWSSLSIVVMTPAPSPALVDVGPGADWSPPPRPAPPATTPLVLRI